MGWFLHAGFVEAGRGASCPFARLETTLAHQARFTSDASHELRTPVSVMLAQTQTALSRERSGSEYREALEACQRAAQYMRQLTASLLELSRLDAGQEPMKREPFDLGRAGLGLAIVEAHGGVVPVTSQPEAGSKFTVKLPAA